MTFETPWLLALLPGIVLLLLITRIIQHFRRKRLNRMFPEAIRVQMQAGLAPGLFVLRSILLTIGFLFIAFALARPQWGYTWRDADRKGLNLMVVIDTSNSMRADDFKPSRLQRAKWGVEEMVKTLKGDRIGLVAFAGQGVLQCPFTLDYGAFMMHMQDLFPGIVPIGGTNLEKALETAISSFEETSEADNVILLITDGENHTGSLDNILAELEKKKIRVFAVGVGTPEGSLIPLDDDTNAYLKNRQEEVVKSTLDEKPLRRLTSSTGGLYIRATPVNFGVDEIINEGLAPLKRAQLDSQQVKEMEDRYQIFLGIGLILLFLERFARVPLLFRKRRAS